MVNREALNQAGTIAVEVLRQSWQEVQPGASILSICKNVERRIQDKGAQPAFPLNFSIDSCAAHDTAAPNDKRTIHESCMVKIDIGVHIDGFIADCASTKLIGQMNGEKLIKTSKIALEAAIDNIRAGITPGDIGKVVESTINSEGFRPIANLTGHSIERYNLHSGISIPSIEGRGLNDDRKLKEGTVLAIEPFVTYQEKKGWVDYAPRPLIFSLMKSGKNPLRKEIEKRFGFLPFASRWIFDLRLDSKLSFNYEGLRSYPPLIEKTDGLVAQSEVTVIVTRNGCEVTTPIFGI